MSALSYAFFVLAVILLFIDIIIFLKNKKKDAVGTINVSKNEEGTNVWTFSFKDNMNYEKISNMKEALFKIKKEE